MASNFDKNFNEKKTEFKKLFNKDWEEDPNLYLNFLQTLYISTSTEILNNGLGQVLSRQNETQELLRHISKKIENN
tara:strand:+ start:3550 stop:3777 length:228 start_codon:yes stop_codon:yes gene_type:complete